MIATYTGARPRCRACKPPVDAAGQLVRPCGGAPVGLARCCHAVVRIAADSEHGQRVGVAGARGAAGRRDAGIQPAAGLKLARDRMAPQPGVGKPAGGGVTQRRVCVRSQPAGVRRGGGGGTERAGVGDGVTAGVCRLGIRRAAVGGARVDLRGLTNNLGKEWHAHHRPQATDCRGETPTQK